MNKLAIIVAATLTAATFGTAVMAQDMDTQFQNADGNKDSVISMEEAQGIVPTLTEAQFKQADANADGTLDEGEFTGLLTLFGSTETSSSSASSSEPSAP